MFQYQILETGFFYADGGAMFGAIPKRAWNRRYPCDEQNCCRMAMRCLLAWDDEHIIVFDTGVGSKDTGNLSYYRFHDLQDISALVRSAGFEPEQVTDVVLSHLHFDHCGGCTYLNENGELQITFPKAKHWIGKKQWDNFLETNKLEEDAFRQQDMMPIKDAGLLQLVEADFKLYKGLRLELYDGHTDGQLVSFIETKEGTLAYVSDLIPTKAHYSIDWISAYDVKPLQSVDAKTAFIEKTRNMDGFMIFYHDVHNKMMHLDVRK